MLMASPCNLSEFSILLKTRRSQLDFPKFENINLSLLCNSLGFLLPSCWVQSSSPTSCSLSLWSRQSDLTTTIVTVLFLLQSRYILASIYLFLSLKSTTLSILSFVYMHIKDDKS